MGSVRWAFPCGAWRPRRREWLLAAQLVQPEEKDRIGQFVFARDAKAALAGRLLMRKLIAEKMCIPWNEVHLQRTSKGKPFLANTVVSINSNYNFNISHQGDYAVLAAEPELQVGIDIMKTNLPGSSSVPNFFHIMKRQFTETEWDVIKSMSNEWMQLDMFYRHWALKESFLKAIGVGIGFNLQRIEFNVSPLQLEVGQVYETRFDDHHHVAVALGKQTGFLQKDSDVRSMEPNPPQFTLLTFEDLVASGIPVAPEDSTYWDNFCSKQESPVQQSSHSR
ncbi:PREDICTED: L-aminoadipate-semialdehyde dehydrogenase-phosphopantetheinyl transferase [Lepidothrix coronata]|uniref:L-aminoadipate-semialdehyde dehydrogenase-phosphopantetheinyl transferase n=1 Tax=Lepidothrix coronata TaxID=321398 RepID=A0A6J0HA33_9PASS|nr:PREDICTED: L-aminoadipate-semialdehyde dehydrogenase-phosphopantetheinyl transferase [Lepidothrix coronata]